ncbi:MAG: hypothetical protein V4469_04540 [Patescibacteria group bacterium]
MRIKIFTKEELRKNGAKGGRAKGRKYKKKKFQERSKQLSMEERFEYGTAPFDEPAEDN